MGQKQAACDESGNIMAFYDTENSPAPASISVVDITDEQWRYLLGGQAEGKRMTINPNGEPELLPPLPLSPDEVRQRNVRIRDALLDAATVALTPLQTAIALGEATDDEMAAARLWIAYVRAVKAIDVAADNPDWPAEPEIAGSN
ncbi:tail fiber assembly protein [Burkholderia multivorans]|uniref:tail fiber assembly protein n=1 Tax=Burkholderia multivorans TaxID=87883 RepID=UPI00123B67E2|nr:tail fiber assembly protein [Burkholderia multivorans]MCO7334100.1 tail fiber assembly protein [Burkholderia multivorans]MCO7341890.1 tail fiber assembly protein [Burkholderia multivorans]MCO7347841.1 tail fiber assembly protein [Burkholderia multivorans]QET32485.1 tail fiber assembly protein [Burkholderia multivorans]QET37713.1 tail fiber assembly protein [Burkholderia multivorans]